MTIFGREKEFEQSAPSVAHPSSPPPRTEPERPGLHAKVGRTIVIRGELSGEEDLTIEGRVEGRVELKDHHLVVGETGNLVAEVEAKTVTIIGRMEGNLTAKERVEIKESGSLVGDIRSPRVVIADGAKFKGSVDMNMDTPSQAKERPKVEHAAPKPTMDKPATHAVGIDRGVTV